MVETHRTFWQRRRATSMGGGSTWSQRNYAETPNLSCFLQACEMFILELTHRSWAHSEENKRRTLQRNDIAAAITRTDIFDFLV